MISKLCVSRTLTKNFGSAVLEHAKIRVIPKAGPYSGGPAPFTDFVRMRNADNSLCFTIQPCHTFGAPQVEYLVNSAFPSGNYLTVWRITNPVAAPVLTRTQMNVSPYSLPPNADQTEATLSSGTRIFFTPASRAMAPAWGGPPPPKA